MAELKAAGADWVQLDEPVLALDLSLSQRVPSGSLQETIFGLRRRSSSPAISAALETTSLLPPTYRRRPYVDLVGRRVKWLDASGSRRAIGSRCRTALVDLDAET